MIGENGRQIRWLDGLHNETRELPAFVFAMKRTEPHPQTVIPRACGVSSTPRLLGSITDASGILDHPPRVMTTEGMARSNSHTQAFSPAARCARAVREAFALK